jgi:hypothetical protein
MLSVRVTQILRGASRGAHKKDGIRCSQRLLHVLVNSIYRQQPFVSQSILQLYNTLFKICAFCIITFN